MDPWTALSSPLTSQTVEYVANTLRIMCAISWNISYMSMTYYSFRDKTYGNALIPLCNNIAWEFVYSFIHCPKLTFVRIENTGWFLLNIGVMYAAIKYSENEWKHAPLVQRNLPFIFAMGISAMIAGHLALAAQIGPRIAFVWSAKGCQLVLSTGALSQLLSRGSTRGGSYVVW
ncbi:integral membrane protein [Aspergillus udagawae]|uniref:Integral membrane protein n=1 Tax=Aspergillus udagawae TaxID=91492 RepID=A0ABQ1ACK8_9EURO|nr:integral membrane protein [Aspergillus udagawae]GFG11761.1 integral membrane protein [Aspergillus udagawae]